jgi:hypothetical protein
LLQRKAGAVETHYNAQSPARDLPQRGPEAVTSKKPFVEPELIHYEPIHRITLVSAGMGFPGGGGSAGGTFFG